MKRSIQHIIEDESCRLLLKIEYWISLKILFFFIICLTIHNSSFSQTIKPKSDSLDQCNCFKYLSYQDSLFNKEIIIQNSKAIINFDSIRSINDTLNVSIKNSTLIIDEFKVNVKYANISFENDTITRNCFIKNWGRSDTKMEIVFSNCYFDCFMSVGNGTKNISVTFNDCEFGPRAFMLKMNVGLISFRNCRRSATPLYLSFDEKSISKIDFRESNIDLINFPYTSHTKIYREPYENEEDFGVYDALAAKYKREGKNNSYKNLMIEYNQVKYGYKPFGSIINFLDKYWWNYGFNKGRIVLWTLVFLTIFLVGNLSIWNTINKYYLLLPTSVQSYYYSSQRKYNYKWDVFFRILLFTFFIFFTFKLDIEKLSRHTTKFMTWVFIQYVIGLICLFFLFNAVLKL